MADTLFLFILWVSTEETQSLEFRQSVSLSLFSLATEKVDYDVLSPRFVSSSWTSSKYLPTLGETIQPLGGISSVIWKTVRNIEKILKFLMDWLNLSLFRWRTGVLSIVWPTQTDIWVYTQINIQWNTFISMFYKHKNSGKTRRQSVLFPMLMFIL